MCFNHDLRTMTTKRVREETEKNWDLPVGWPVRSAVLTMRAIRFAEGPVAGLHCIRVNTGTQNLEPLCVGAFSLENRKATYERRMVPSEQRWTCEELEGTECYLFCDVGNATLGREGTG